MSAAIRSMNVAAPGSRQLNRTVVDREESVWLRGAWSEVEVHPRLERVDGLSVAGDRADDARPLGRLIAAEVVPCHRLPLLRRSVALGRHPR